uniref:Uncharacterized protein n=1 Tax=Rhizophora mucronata TaxID=61149 RepID=A0A2P2PCK3_RHIMU
MNSSILIRKSDLATIGCSM